MGKPYLYERQTEYWTSRGIEDYFLDAGYEVITFPLSQLSEHKVPFDFIFFEKTTCKLFGIQYKTLYKNKCNYWPLNEKQHKQLQSFGGWGYYCLSQLKEPKDHRVAIHKSLFVPVTINYTQKLCAGEIDTLYYRWGGFVNGLERCTVGKKIASQEDIEQALNLIGKEYIAEMDNLLDLFVVNLDKKRLLHIDNRCERK